MSAKNLKLWTCYPKKIENFQEITEDEEENNPHSYEEASESYGIENFTQNKKSWSCYTAKEVEGFEAVSETETETVSETDSDNDSETASDDNKKSKSSIEETAETLKVSIFGDGPNSDYYFYGSIAAVIFIIILMIRK